MYTPVNPRYKLHRYDSVIEIEHKIKAVALQRRLTVSGFVNET